MTMLRELKEALAPSRRSHDDAGFGKLILFGEHFVVHNCVPALVVAVKAKTTCVIELSPADEWSSGLIVEDNRPAVEGYKLTKCDEMLEATKRTLLHLGIDSAKRGVKVILGGDLCAVSGIGASAANCVSIARAVSTAMDLRLTNAQINAAGYEGEKAYHGTPSGIDNTCSTYGGLLQFHRTDDPSTPFFKTTSISSSCRVVYASSGITSSTTEVVGDVAKRKAEDPDWYSALESRYLEIHSSALEHLRDGNWAQIAPLLDENHRLLQELGVSCAELDDLVDTARSAGAAGAKLSGTGRGGLMFALCLDESSARSVEAALRAKVPHVWSTEM